MNGKNGQLPIPPKAVIVVRVVRDFWKLFCERSLMGEFSCLDVSRKKIREMPTMSIKGRIGKLGGDSKEEAKGEATANYAHCNGGWGWW